MSGRFGGGSKDDWYDDMEVCLNGHRITSFATSEPTARQKFCAECGAQTITSCRNCGTQIRGYRHRPNYPSMIPSEAPSYCIGCGQALPWQASKLQSLEEVLVLGGISADDMVIVRETIDDIAKETPKSEVATLKMKVVLKKLGKDFYGVALKVATDLASEYSKKMLNS